MVVWAAEEVLAGRGGGVGRLDVVEDCLAPTVEPVPDLVLE